MTEAESGGNRIVDTFKDQWQRRPVWLNLVLLFCLYMTFIYLPFDLFWKPVAEDAEVWFGFTLYGWWAKATAPLHWLIYGAGAYALWHMRWWGWHWGVLYSAQVAIAMLVWNLDNPNGGGWIAGLIAGGIFSLLVVAFVRSKHRFAGREDQEVRPAT